MMSPTFALLFHRSLVSLLILLQNQNFLCDTDFARMQFLVTSTVLNSHIHRFGYLIFQVTDSSSVCGGFEFALSPVYEHPENLNTVNISNFTVHFNLGSIVRQVTWVSELVLLQEKSSNPKGPSIKPCLEFRWHNYLTFFKYLYTLLIKNKFRRKTNKVNNSK